MATLDKTVLDVIVGTDYIFSKVEDIVESGQTIVKAVLSIKEEWWDLEDDAVLTKTITTVANADGVITNNGFGGVPVEFEFYLTDADTLTLSPYFKYFYKIRVEYNSGHLAMTEEGTLIPLPGEVDS